MSHHESQAPRTARPRLARRSGGVFIPALEILDEPAYWILEWFKAHFERKYLGRYRHARRLFLLDLCLVALLLILAVTALWALILRRTSADDIVLAAQTEPTGLISGAPATIMISFTNDSRETITEAVLAVRPPRHFETLRTFPKQFAERTNSLPLGTLRPGETGRASIAGVFWGNVDEQAPIFLTMAFTSSKTGERFIAYERVDIPTVDSTLTGELELPDRLVAGQLTPFTFIYKNQGVDPLAGVSVRPDLPRGVGIADSIPPLTDGVWIIGGLPPGKEGKIVGRMRLGAAPDAEIKLSFEPSLIRNTEQLTQKPVTLSRPLIPAPLELVATLAGDKDGYVRPGDTLTLSIRAANTGAAALTDVVIGLASASPLVSEEALAATTTLPRLEVGAQKTVSLSFDLASALPPAISTDNSPHEPLFSVRPTARAFLIDGAPLTIETEGETITRKMQTPFLTKAAARYWTPQGDQIGRGPLPPVVGETTKYWIFWQLEPTTNTLSGLSWSTHLPPEAQWTNRGNVTAGNPLVWDAETRTVNWTVGELPATFGTGKTVAGRFEVAFTPTENQIGATPALIGETRIVAHDTFTESDLSSVLPALTTALPSDWRAEGRNRVQP